MKWTKEKCYNEALKYKYRNEFKIKSASAYRISLKNKWLDDISKHMKKPYEKCIKWDKEHCQKEVLKYKYEIDIINNNKSAYNSIIKNKWFDLLSHFEKKYKPKYYWTKERCYEEALKYNFRNEFKKNNNIAYKVSINNNWIDDITKHMVKKYKDKDYWTKENCQKEALKYNYKTDFIKNSPNYYQKSVKNNWIDDICSHMEIVGNRYNRLIYVYEFADNHCYIGLTGNLNRRNNQHTGKEKNSKSSVFEHINNTKLIPKLIKLTDYIHIEDAIIKEKYYVEKYIENGWIILNKIKTGGLGGNKLKWHKDACQKEALKYNKRGHFAKKSQGAYSSSLKNQWLNEICNHMI
jgi:predicted GIY-YIG superfamily endonuclease